MLANLSLYSVNLVIIFGINYGLIKSKMIALFFLSNYVVPVNNLIKHDRFFKTLSSRSALTSRMFNLCPRKLNSVDIVDNA